MAPDDSGIPDRGLCRQFLAGDRPSLFGMGEPAYAYPYFAYRLRSSRLQQGQKAGQRRIDGGAVRGRVIAGLGRVRQIGSG